MNKTFSLLLVLATLALCAHSSHAYTCYQNYVQKPLQTIDISDPTGVQVNQTAGSNVNGCYGNGCSIDQVYYCGSPAAAQSTGTISVNLYLPKVGAVDQHPNNTMLVQMKNSEMEQYISSTFLTSSQLPSVIEVDAHLERLFDELAQLVGIDANIKKRSNANILRLQPSSPKKDSKSATLSTRSAFVCGWSADYTTHEITVKDVITGNTFQWASRNPQYCWWGGCSIVKQALQDIPSDTWCAW